MFVSFSRATLAKIARISREPPRRLHVSIDFFFHPSIPDKAFDTLHSSFRDQTDQGLIFVETERMDIERSTVYRKATDCPSLFSFSFLLSYDSLLSLIELPRLHDEQLCEKYWNHCFDAGLYCGRIM